MVSIAPNFANVTMMPSVILSQELVTVNWAGWETGAKSLVHRANLDQAANIRATVRTVLVAIRLLGAVSVVMGGTVNSAI